MNRHHWGPLFSEGTLGGMVNICLKCQQELLPLPLSFHSVALSLLEGWTNGHLRFLSLSWTCWLVCQRNTSSDVLWLLALSPQSQASFQIFWSIYSWGVTSRHPVTILWEDHATQIFGNSCTPLLSSPLAMTSVSKPVISDNCSFTWHKTVAT